MPATSPIVVRQRRVRTPTVLQMEAVECGAAALAIILEYYRRIVPLEELRVACAVSRDGTKASNIVKAARQYGLEAKGFSKEPADLQLLRLPFIVFWNFNHFVVVEGFRKGRVYLNDPAVGPRVVSSEEFDQSFTGVVLVFEPRPDFEPGGRKRSLLTALRQRLTGCEAALWYILLSSLALTLPGLLIPVFTRVFVDYYLVAELKDWVRPLLIGMAITALFRAALTWLQRKCLLRLETRLSLTSSYRFFRHVLQLPMEFFTQRYAGEIGSRVAINDRVAQLLSGDLATTLLSLLMAVFYLLVMLYYDVVLTLVGLAIAAINIAALRFVARQRVDLNQRLLMEKARQKGVALAGLQTIETMKATAAEADFFARWAGYQAKVFAAEQTMGLYSLLLSTVPVFLSAFNIAVILTLGAYRVIDGQLTVGMLVAFQSLMFSFLEPVQLMVGLGSTLQEVEGEMNRLDDVLNYPADPECQGAAGHAQAMDLPIKLSGQLEFHDVTFGYNRLEAPLVNKLNLCLRPGTRVAVVGPTASGKSTLVKLASGLYQPWEGKVLLDGQPRGQLPRRLIASSVALVDQDFFFCEGSIREMLSMWDPTVPEESLVQAAKDACIHDEIAARPGGYESKIDEGGANFSGGQRQRLEIARALVGNPALLILDEATSALDPVTEKRIDENLRWRGCTCLIVAHRLSTVRDCDEIIVLDRGQVVQRGTHERLIQDVGGLYHRLVTAG